MLGLACKGHLKLRWPTETHPPTFLKALQALEDQGDPEHPHLQGKKVNTEDNAGGSWRGECGFKH